MTIDDAYKKWRTETANVSINTKEIFRAGYCAGLRAVMAPKTKGPEQMAFNGLDLDRFNDNEKQS